MPSRFLNNININDEYSLPNADGSADQIITTDGAGQLSFVDQSTINAGNAEHVVIYAKNTHTAPIAKGTPVYITGTVGATDTVQIAPADASNSAKMPAVGLLDDTLAINAFGYVITGGFMDNITTDPIDGATPSSNDTVYVKVGGGLTLTKPTGPTGLIQNIAKVGKVSGGNSGSLIVSSILRTNDVPNLTTGKIWVGDGNTTESTVVHLDEPNGRMGIGTTSPSHKLDVDGGAQFNTNTGTTPFYITRLGSTDQALSIKVMDDNVRFESIQDEAADNYGGFDFRMDGGVTEPDFVIRKNAGNPILNVKGDGKVGIGTTSPGSTLEVTGEIDAYGGDGYRIETKPFANWGSDLLTLGDWDGEGYETRFMGSSSSEVMRVTDTKVGIGTTSPSDKLTVENGNIRLNSTSSYPAQGLYAYWNNGSPNMGGISWHNNPGFIGSEWNHYKQSSPYTQSRIRLIGDANGGMYVNLNNSDVFSILASNGNVGIGNTSPSNSLVVGIGTSNSSDRSNTLLSETSTGGTANALGLVNSAYGAYGNATALNFHLSRTYSPTARIIAYQDGSSSQTDTGLKFFTYNGSLQQRMHIDHDGNVGIGTTSAGEKLEVNGHVKAVDGYKGYVSYFHNAGFFHNPRSTDGANPLWIPINSTAMSSSDQYYNTWVPLYAGRVRKIILKHISGSTPVATVCTFYKRINGTTSGTTYTGTVTGGGAVGMKVTFDFGTSNFTFNAEDEVQIGVVTGVATQPRMGGMSCQIWYEYNIT